MLDLDNLVEYWGNKQLTPMLLIDEDCNISWHNRWAAWLFKTELSNKNLRQLPTGDRLAVHAAKVREYNAPSVIQIIINGLSLDVEGRLMDESSNLMILKFHTRYLSRPSMLEMHKFMQDMALETGDRVNNPLTTVLNCLNMIQMDLKNNKTEKLETYVELAIREAHAMKDFGDWVRRLSEEPPFGAQFNVLSVMKKVLDRRNCLHYLEAEEDLPLAKGSADHAALVMGGLVNLVRQACGDKDFAVKITTHEQSLIIVEINAPQSRVKDLRMLSEEFYGGLGLLAARYLLSLMQAQLELEFMGDIGVRVTFVSSTVAIETDPAR